MHYLYAAQTPETSLFDDVKQRPDRKRRHPRSAQVASTSTSPSRRLPAADDDEFSYALSSALASAMTIARAETILEASLAFELPPPKRPVPRGSVTRTKSSEVSKPNVVPATSSQAEGEGTDDWQTEYEAYLRTWRAQSAETRERAEKERKRWEELRAAENARAGLPSREPSRTHVTYTATTGVPSPSPADVRDLVTGEPQKHVCSLHHGPWHGLTLVSLQR
ncbi:hypothetical protein HDZ31DRAFT_32759 [Schizophyllum fasciatum]